MENKQLPQEAWSKSVIKLGTLNCILKSKTEPAGFWQALNSDWQGPLLWTLTFVPHSDSPDTLSGEGKDVSIFFPHNEIKIIKI